MARSKTAPTESKADAPQDDSPGLARFETAVSELESLVETLESGDVSLEDALTRFERGVVLTRECQQLLKNAELRVDQLLGDDNGGRIADFDDKLPTDSG